VKVLCDYTAIRASMSTGRGKPNGSRQHGQWLLFSKTHLQKLVSILVESLQPCELRTMHGLVPILVEPSGPTRGPR